jgi:uncharacterized protein (UPF0276 family)
MLLDVSHVLSYALATERPASAILRSLPLATVEEIHVAGGRIDPRDANRYIDSHSERILPQVIEILDEAVSSCPSLRAITFEIGNRMAIEDIAADFNLLEQRVGSAGWTPNLSRYNRIGKAGLETGVQA